MTDAPFLAANYKRHQVCRFEMQSLLRTGYEAVRQRLNGASGRSPDENRCSAYPPFTKRRERLVRVRKRESLHLRAKGHGASQRQELICIPAGYVRYGTKRSFPPKQL